MGDVGEAIPGRGPIEDPIVDNLLFLLAVPGVLIGFLAVDVVEDVLLLLGTGLVLLRDGVLVAVADAGFLVVFRPIEERRAAILAAALVDIGSGSGGDVFFLVVVITGVVEDDDVTPAACNEDNLRWLDWVDIVIFLCVL